ncbi:MAG TPA: copper resistance CopC family protein [Candidatus Binatia bacterium]|nr:copper resistance CopC family protein [Candidatus Binatia bacterium]
MQMRRQFGRAALAVALAGFLLAAATASGHAILVESNPAANSKIHGPTVAVRLKFNSRIDGSRSRLTLFRPDGTSGELKIQEQSTPDSLASEATGLKPGSHRIHWQVLAADGHITRGDISFTVTEN